MKITNLTEGKLKYQGQLDQDLGEWLSPRGSQPLRGFFYEEEKQKFIRIEDSAQEGAIISNQAPYGGTSAMLVVKWSYAVERYGENIPSPLCGGSHNGRGRFLSSLVRNRSGCQDEFLHLLQIGQCLDCPRISL